MENGKAEDTHEDEPDLHMIQLQALWAELKAGLRGVVQEISSLQQSNSSLEERVSVYQRDAAEKILSLKNTLNTVQEETGPARTQISDLGIRLKELRSDVDELQRSQRRKFSRGEELVDGFSRTCGRTLHYVSSPPTNPSVERDASAFRNHSRSTQKERRNSRDGDQEMSQRHVSALELLESERVYVSYLSLLLKANISFNGLENSNLRDKRPFPSSLRFLIQQHLELLNLLQERVLRSHWHGIMGDVFLRLTSKESDFLENYISYLKELPECLSVVGSKLVGLIEDDTPGHDTRPSLRALLLRPVRRIPEYLGRLQILLRHTEAEHPDYYLLLVCVQRLRCFTAQYGDLFQQTCQTHGRSSLKQLYRVDCESSSNYSNSSALSDPVHGARRAQKAAVRRPPEWEPEPIRFSDISFDSDSESQQGAELLTPHRIHESAGTGSALADAMETFLPRRGANSHCSSPSNSTDSSIDIAFVRCSVPSGVTTTAPRPLQAAQRKSKSLNGLQADCADGQQGAASSPAHQRLVRQSSARARPTHGSPERYRQTGGGRETRDSGTPQWEEPKWKSVSEEADHAPSGERSRKEGKGFRSSFKKLFRKKSGADTKVERSAEKTEAQSSSDPESNRSNRAAQPRDAGRGTVV